MSRGDIVFVAVDAFLILGVFADRQDAMDACERDWAADSGGKPAHWSDNTDELDLIHTAYDTCVRNIVAMEIS